MQRAPESQPMTAARVKLFDAWIKLCDDYKWTRTKQQDVLSIRTGKTSFRECTNNEMRAVLKAWGRDPDGKVVSA